MGISVQEHITIVCAQLQRTRDFYVGVIGPADGAGPKFPFRGHCLYLGDIPVVHLVEAADKASAWGGEIVISRAGEGTGSFDDVAFRGDDGVAMKARLDRAGITYRERMVQGGAISQFFVPDPEGVLVDINFRNS